jgi:thiamine pyrophosphate-dependent acetolactate synthase large subunit-like protein
MAAMINAGKRVTSYGESGCEGAEREIVALAQKVKAPLAHPSRAKDFSGPNNPHNVGMTGILGDASGFRAMDACDTLLLLGADFAWSQFYPHEAKLIRADSNATHLGRPIRSTWAGSGISGRRSRRGCGCWMSAKKMPSCATASTIASRPCRTGPRKKWPALTA